MRQHRSISSICAKKSSSKPPRVLNNSARIIIHAPLVKTRVSYRCTDRDLFRQYRRSFRDKRITQPVDQSSACTSIFELIFLTIRQNLRLNRTNTRIAIQKILHWLEPTSSYFNIIIKKNKIICMYFIKRVIVAATEAKVFF